MKTGTCDSFGCHNRHHTPKKHTQAGGDLPPLERVQLYCRKQWALLFTVLGVVSFFNTLCSSSEYKRWHGIHLFTLFTPLMTNLPFIPARNWTSGHTRMETGFAYIKIVRLFIYLVVINLYLVTTKPTVNNVYIFKGKKKKKTPNKSNKKSDCEADFYDTQQKHNPDVCINSTSSG